MRQKLFVVGFAWFVKTSSPLTRAGFVICSTQLSILYQVCAISWRSLVIYLCQMASSQAKDIKNIKPTKHISARQKTNIQTPNHTKL